MRYNPDKIDNLSDVLTPPYDVISPDGQREYYKRHPANIIRVDYAIDEPGVDKYARASDALTLLMHDHTLVHDHEPAIYVTETSFTNINGEHRVRTGFTALLRLEKFGRGDVYPHEKTFPKHKVDRLSLLRATHAQYNPVFMVFPDPDAAARGLLDVAVEAAPPDASFRSDDGAEHTLRRVTDKKLIKKLRKVMADRPVFIADGHHRYETGINFRKETKQRLGKLPKSHPARFALVYFAPMESPGLELTSPHRLLKDIPGLSADRLPELLGGRFDIAKTDRAAALDSIQHDADRKSFAVQIGAEFFFLTPSQNSGAGETLFPVDMSESLRKLDVNICTYTIIYPLIGAETNILDHVGYEVDPAKACECVENGEYQAAIYIPATKMQQIMDVVAAKEVLPHKTTYFYPKLPTGLVIYHLNME